MKHMLKWNTVGDPIFRKRDLALQQMKNMTLTSQNGKYSRMQVGNKWICKPNRIQQIDAH